jgi:hypothetical protein
MKNIFVRTAVAALFAAGTLATLSAAPAPGQSKGPAPQTPIPICFGCGRNGN